MGMIKILKIYMKKKFLTIEEHKRRQLGRQAKFQRPMPPKLIYKVNLMPVKIQTASVPLTRQGDAKIHVEK